MPMNFGPIEILFVLALWALPVEVVIWFIRTIIAMRDSLRSIDHRLERIEGQRKP